MEDQMFSGAQSNSGPISAACHGGSVSREELIAHLEEVAVLQRELQQLQSTAEEARKRGLALKSAAEQPWCISFPVVPEPRGLAALSPRRRREYQEWEAAAPEREAADRQRRAQLWAEADAAFDVWLTNDKQRQIHELHLECLYSLEIIPPDCRAFGVPASLLGYLREGGARTLEEAIAMRHDFLRREQALLERNRQLEKALQAMERKAREEEELRRAKEEAEALEALAGAVAATQLELEMSDKRALDAADDLGWAVGKFGRF